VKKALQYFKKLKLAIKVIILFIVSFLIYEFISSLSNLPSISQLFKSKKATIAQTDVIVLETKKIAQLFSVVIYQEIVQDSTYYTTNNGLLSSLNLNQNNLSTNQIIIICKGKIMAGINMDSLNSKHIYIKNDSISLTLPHASILESIINPSDIEIFDSKGNWPQHLVNEQILHAKQKMMVNALNQNIIEKADKQITVLLQQFWQAAGYKKINIIFKS
jgi:hypothetical protein